MISAIPHKNIHRDYTVTPHIVSSQQPCELRLRDGDWPKVTHSINIMEVWGFYHLNLGLPSPPSPKLSPMLNPHFSPVHKEFISLCLAIEQSFLHFCLLKTEAVAFWQK